MLISVDPGIRGGIAVKMVESEIEVYDMPETPEKIYNFLRALTLRAENIEYVKIYIEKTGTYVSGNSGPSAAKFAKHCGLLEGFLIALGYPFIEVTPQVWQKFFIGKQTYPKIPEEIQGKERKRILAQWKTERKNKIKVKAQELCPNMKITLKVADAVGILAYGEAQDDSLR